MSTTPNASNRPVGATRVGGEPARRKWLWPLLLGLLALIILLFLLSRCGNDDPAKPTPGASATAAGTPSAADPTSASVGSPSVTGPTGTGQSGQAGSVTADGGNLLGAGVAPSLGGHEGEQAVGHAVRVQSVPADEGFWVGESEQSRLWVQLTGTRGESDYQVKQGDVVDFTGTVTKAPAGFAGKVGVTGAEGAEQLTQQGAYVSVPASDVELSR